MHILVDANNPVAYIATGYREGSSGLSLFFRSFCTYVFYLIMSHKTKNKKIFNIIKFPLDILT